MARLFIDGFESGGLDLWDTINGAASASGTQKKTGSYALYCSANSIYVIKNLASAISTIFIKKWVYFTAVGSTGPHHFLVFSDNSGTQISIGITVGRQLGFYRLPTTNGGGTLLGSLGTTVLALNTWYLIEAKIVIDNATGIAELKLNGALPLEIDFDGDTQGQAGNTVTKVTLGSYGINNFHVVGYFDDVVLDDAAWIGDTRIQAIVPTGAGNSSNWTPSAGNNWDCVEEVPASDANYVYTNANDILDTYVMGDLVGGVSEVKCVQVQARTVRQGASTPTNLKLAVRSGGTDYVSGDKAVPASYKSLFNIWETDPATSAAWIVSGVNSAEIGTKSAA